MDIISSGDILKLFNGEMHGPVPMDAIDANEMFQMPLKK